MTEHYYALSYGDDIYHYGIKGQRWGVRRYQNPDGTLTDKGKLRQYGTRQGSKMVYKERFKKMKDSGASDDETRDAYKGERAANAKQAAKGVGKSLATATAVGAGLGEAAARSHFMSTMTTAGYEAITKAGPLAAATYGDTVLRSASYKFGKYAVTLAVPMTSDIAAGIAAIAGDAAAIGTAVGTGAALAVGAAAVGATIYKKHAQNKSLKEAAKETGVVIKKQKNG